MTGIFHVEDRDCLNRCYSFRANAHGAVGKHWKPIHLL